MITITKKAADEILLSMQNPDTQGMVIRFAVDIKNDKWSYLMGFDERRDNDINLESSGVEYILSYDQKSLLEGMVLDFDQVDENSEYSFIFMNPNDPNYKAPDVILAPTK